MKTNFHSLRLFLASMVPISHSFEMIYGNRTHEPATRLGSPLTLGEWAVRGFFLLSGFLIMQSWRREPSVTAFMRKRVLRIYPGFVVCFILCYEIGLSFGGDPNWLFNLKRMLTLQQPLVAGAFNGTFYPSLNGSTWTILFEFACYVTIAVIGNWLTPRRLVLLAVLGFTASFFELPSTGIYSWIGGYLMLSPWFFIGAIFAFTGIPNLRLPRLETDISYGVYLYSWPIQKLLLWHWPTLNAWELSLLALIGACVMGYASCVLVEEPCLQLKCRTVWLRYSNRKTTA